MSFTVTKVIDSDTFEVSPNWKWNEQGIYARIVSDAEKHFKISNNTLNN